MSSTIDIKQLRELHLDALQSIFHLSDAMLGAVELAIQVELSHQDINTTHHLLQLHKHLSLCYPQLDVHFDVGEQALEHIKQLEALTIAQDKMLADTHGELADTRRELAAVKQQLEATTTPAAEQEEAGTEAAANPPTPAPTPAVILSTISHSANGNGTNGNGAGKTKLTISRPLNLLPLDLTYLSPELQETVAALRGEEIDWKSLMTEQKKALGIEIAAQILSWQANPNAELTRELYDSNRPMWMPTMHALCLGTPIAANELRSQAANLAASRAQSREASEASEEASSANPSPSSDAASNESEPGNS